MPKLNAVNNTDGSIEGYCFGCPGCGGDHYLVVRPNKADNGASWEFNGNLEKPTFSPSVLSRVQRPDSSKTMICHSFIRGGQIQFLNDCTHELAGQTVDIPE